MMSMVSDPSASPLTFITLDRELDVTARLAQLKSWITAWQEEDEHLRQRVMNLNPTRRHEVLLGSQIASLRRQLAFKVADAAVLSVVFRLRLAHGTFQID